MRKKAPIEVEVLELKALAKVLGHTYGTMKVYVADKIKKNEPLEFGDRGQYKLFGQPGKMWFAYNAEKYAIKMLTADDIPEPEAL